VFSVGNLVTTIIYVHVCFIRSQSTIPFQKARAKLPALLKKPSPLTEMMRKMLRLEKLPNDECNRLLDTEFPASVTKNAASCSHGPFSGTMQRSVDTSLDISSHSRIKDKHLLSLDKCTRFYCRFALGHIDCKLIQFKYTNFTIGAGHGVLICRRN
jgi:hypothetical protein